MYRTASSWPRISHEQRCKRRARLERGDEPVLAAVPQDRVDDGRVRDPGHDLHLDAAPRVLPDILRHLTDLGARTG